MRAQFLLPAPTQLRLEWIDFEDHTIHLAVSPNSLYSVCPDCEQECVRIHSYYSRKPADLPCGGFAVRLHLSIRRFFCDNPACSRRTFTERLPDVLASFARRTRRLAEAHRTIAFSLGGEAGAKLTRRLGMPTSPDTLLRMISTTPETEAACPRVLGVDDWAIRKSHSYGTILVDLERRQVIDLLPDRKPETLAKWLNAHPAVEIISRDRGEEYIRGIEQGAPQAIQVADRFQLLQNLLDVMERLFKRCPNELRRAAQQCSPTDKPATQIGNLEPTENKTEGTNPLPRNEKREKTYRQIRFEAVKALQAQGCNRRGLPAAWESIAGRSPNTSTWKCPSSLASKFFRFKGASLPGLFTETVG